MLRISKLASYATAIMVCLAHKPQTLYSAKDLAQELHLAAPTVSKICKKILAANLLQSTLGANGGYQLSRPAENITLAAIIAAIDGAPALTACCDANHHCLQTSTCMTKSNWQIINAAILGLLRRITLADMSETLAGHEVFNNFHLRANV